MLEVEAKDELMETDVPNEGKNCPCNVVTVKYLPFFSKMHTDLYVLECMYDFIPEKPKLPEKKYYVDTNHIHLPKENMEIINPVKDGMSEYEEYFNCQY